VTELTGMIDFDVTVSFHSGEEKILVPLRGKFKSSFLLV
jgi:hypothetical protein